MKFSESVLGHVIDELKRTGTDAKPDSLTGFIRDYNDEPINVDFDAVITSIREKESEITSDPNDNN